MKSKHYLLFLSFVGFAAYSPVSDAQVINTYAGTVLGYSGDNGLATHAELNNCTGVAVDGAGNVYIADKGNNVVRKVNVTTGYITTFAGNDTAGYSGDGHQAVDAKLNQPYALATDVAGNVYIADGGNNVIRIVSASGIINTYAGNGTAGYSGDYGLASLASLNNPRCIAIDSSGNLYIADANNNVIREVSSGGVISTIAGNGSAGYSGDNGNALAASLYYPSGVAVDVFGNVYIADQTNNVVREVFASNNVIKTIAGNHTIGSSGDGGPAVDAQLTFPASVSLDQAGNLYIADQGNYVIRRIDSSGNINLFAGDYTEGYTGDGGSPTAAKLGIPSGVTADGWGRIYIADFDNSVVRIVTQGSTGVASVTSATGVKVYPNPASGSINVEIPGAANAAITVTDVLGNIVASANANTTTTIVNLANMPAGNYIVKVVNADKTYVNKIEIQK